MMVPAVRVALLYGGIVAGTVAITELAARAVGWSPQYYAFPRAVDSLGNERYGHASGGYGDLMPGQDGHWLNWYHRPYRVQSNSVGLRNVEEPRAGAVRVLAVGDSQTFGPYQTNEDTWPGWSQALLRRRLSGTMDVQVFNAGVSGYTVEDIVELLDQKALNLEPHVIVLAAYENDLTDFRAASRTKFSRRTKDPESTDIAFKEVRDLLRRVSALYNLARELREIATEKIVVTGARGITPAPAPEPQQANSQSDIAALRDAYAQSFRRLHALVVGRKIPLLVFFIPSPDALALGSPSLLAPLLRDLTDELGIGYVDLTAPLQEVPDGTETVFLLQWSDKTRAFEGNGHLSRYGARLVGAAVSDRLLAHPALDASSR
ncbi:MAG: SGNH/GDSL hydrolase family protein [Alphaproteobacteria bacterium]|nr:SGNH/GDSL hydrolase family protein [Alphaproteobacteria bacterium]